MIARFAMNTDYKILVVDDDELVLEVVQKLLSGLPYTVVATSSPAKAIQILSMWEVAVLLCDLNMPDIDGIEVLNRAREINPDIVSILITGFADQEATIRAINEGGIWKYIPKPWKNEELVAVVNQAVERYDRLHRPQAELTSLARGVTARMRVKDDIKPRSKPVVVFKKKRAAEELPGGRYKLGEVIGEGGTGIVYRAEDMLLGMPVAVKIISPELAGDKEIIETLKEEARIAMQLSHRHIVRLHNLQISGGEYYLVMEYVKGETFRQILSVYGKVPLDSVLQVVEVACDALAYAHRHNVIHQDLKPENMLLTDDGVLKIIDFGIAGFINVKRKTQSIMGTPAYMSPEQIRGEDLDARTDIYSLGIIVYEMLTGECVFPPGTHPQTVLQMMPPKLTGLPDDLLDVLNKAVAMNRDDRLKSAGAFARSFIGAGAPIAREQQSA
ncbi:MAG: hypothetical protein C0404_00840 [Verrucomicrobia bacterium]|nr:hypothetical protein [Verrucomicrobiota bacterium]